MDFIKSSLALGLILWPFIGSFNPSTSEILVCNFLVKTSDCCVFYVYYNLLIYILNKKYW